MRVSLAIFALALLCRTAALAACDDAPACTSGACCNTVDCSFVPMGIVCRSAAGHPCDLDESCDGSTADCPPDVTKVAGTECRPAAGTCDVAESCDGSSVDCPADAVEPST